MTGSASLLTEDDLVAFFPHLRHQSLAGIYNAREAGLDVLELAKRLEDVLSCKSEEC